MRSRSTASASTGSSSRSPAFDRDALAERRRRHFRHVPARRVRSERAALAFVEDVGICSTFYVFAEGLACLWEAVVGRANPRWPRRSHHDAGIGLAWTLKDRLPGGRHVYYGKLLKGRPVLVALDVLPAFYAVVRGGQRARSYVAEYEAGRLSLTARRLMANQRQDLTGDLAKIQGQLFWCTLFYQRTDPGDDFAGTATIAGDILQRLSQLLEVWLGIVKPVKADIGVSDYGAERLVHFVRDRSRQLAHCSNAADVGQFSLRVAQFFFGALALDSEIQLRSHSRDYFD